MAKKGFLVLVLAGGAFAAETGGGTGTAADFTGRVFINAGINLGISMGKANYNTITPFNMPLSVSFDVKLPFGAKKTPVGEMFFTAGGMLFYSGLRNKSPEISDVGFGIRPALYITRINLFEKLFKNVDPNKLVAYMALPIGYVVQSSVGGETFDEGSGFHLGLDFGTRFFFIKNLAVYAEINLNLRWMGGGIGLSARF